MAASSARTGGDQPANETGMRSALPIDEKSWLTKKTTKPRLTPETTSCVSPPRRIRRSEKTAPSIDMAANINGVDNS